MLKSHKSLKQKKKNGTQRNKSKPSPKQYAFFMNHDKNDNYLPVKSVTRAEIGQQNKFWPRFFCER